jgi:hypothetical protein
MSAVRLLAPTVVSAVLYGLAFPPIGWRLGAWIALVPFLLALRRASRRGALLLAWGWLLVMAWTVGDALPRAVATYYEQSTLFGVTFAVAVFSLHGAPYYMAFAAWYRAVRALSAVWMPLLTAAAWVALDGRIHGLAGCVLERPGYTEERHGAVSDAPVDVASVAVDHRLEHLEAAVDDHGQVLRVRPLGHGGEAREVDEQHRRLAALTVPLGGVIVHGLLAVIPAGEGPGAAAD